MSWLNLRTRILVFLVVAVIAAGVGTLYLHNQADYAHSNLEQQLASQKIKMPTSAAFKGLKPEDVAALKPYEGQDMTTGDQAKAYADHFIARHLEEMGFTYSEISQKYLENPTNAKIAGLRLTIFMGTMLRATLLNAWGWSQIADRTALFSWLTFALFVVLVLLLIVELFAPDREALAKI
jgi:hypothetical protein